MMIVPTASPVMPPLPPPSHSAFLTSFNLTIDSGSRLPVPGDDGGDCDCDGDDIYDIITTTVIVLLPNYLVLLTCLFIL
jgi:hypothetical protein